MRNKEPLVVVGSAFVAKYPEGGGNFCVPLQYILGLRRMGLPFLWLEMLPESGNSAQDARRVRLFRARLAALGLEDHFHLEFCDSQGIPTGRTSGLGRRRLEELLRRSHLLLNLSYSIRPPLLEMFEHRMLCSLDPTEIAFWMQRMEMGQSHHQYFATIGLATGQPGCRVPETPVRWHTYFPLVDTDWMRPAPRPPRDRFSTVGQWYWDGAVEWEGQWRDFSKRAAFEKFFGLPALVPGAEWVLAVNLAADDPEEHRITSYGWRFVHPHRAIRTPAAYLRFLAASSAEFTAVKLESFTRSGWLSDRSAAYMAMGRPVITEPTGAEPFLPERPGLFFVQNAEEAAEAAREILADWPTWSARARQTAVECLDSITNLRKLLCVAGF